MREVADAERIRRLLAALGRESHEPTAAYLTGGATAVLVGWRDTTVDVDIVFRPERDELLRAIARLKEELRVNVELASPADFIPLPAGSDDRAIFVVTEGALTAYHFDPYAQALAKVQRAHDRDLDDVSAMVRLGLVDPGRARRLFEEIEPELYRFPAIDPGSYRRRIEEAFPP